MNELIHEHALWARQLLRELRSALDQGAALLAQACLVDGKLAARRLDAKQVASFELAWAGAELLAAEAVLTALDADADELQARLALVFTVDAITSLLDRLDVVHDEMDADATVVSAIVRQRPA